MLSSKADARRGTAGPDGTRGDTSDRRTSDRRTSDRRTSDDGTAVLEVLVLGVGVLVPLLYAVVSVMAVQSASYAATSAAREAARAYVTASTTAQGAARARAATRLVLADAGVGDVAPKVVCVGGCLVPGSRVDVTVTVRVALPLVPGSPTVSVVGEESMPVDRYREDP